MVFASERGAYPSPVDNAASVVAGPGSETTITLSQTFFTAYSTRAKPCMKSEEPIEFVNFLDTNQSVSYPYSKWTCLAKARGDIITSRCNCSYHGVPLLTSLKGKFSACYDLREIWEGRVTSQQLLERDRCVSETLEELEDQKNSTCRTRRALCSRVKYKAESFSTPWPVSALIDVAGEWYVLPRMMYLLRKGILPLSLLETGKAYDKLVNDISLRTLLVRENFLSVLINTAGPTAQKSQEILAYPMPNLFSDIGGILGLYLGASVLSICEVLEAFYAFYRKVALVKTHAKNEKDVLGQRVTQLVQVEEKGNESKDESESTDAVPTDPEEFVIRLPKFKD